MKQVVLAAVVLLGSVALAQSTAVEDGVAGLAQHSPVVVRYLGVQRLDPLPKPTGDIETVCASDVRRVLDLAIEHIDVPDGPVFVTLEGCSRECELQRELSALGRLRATLPILYRLRYQFENPVMVMECAVTVQ